MTRLLIVDDKQQDLYMLQVLLSTNDFAVELASNGVEALEQARRAPPDMIISDILMPVMDGFSLCRAWKEDERLKGIPFVFYTATYTDPKDEDFALSLGAERFIVKPVEPDKFLALLRETIETHEAGKLAAPREPIEEEAEYYKEYNAALIRKLEAKVLQLKQAHQRLAVLYQASNGLAVLKSAGELVLTALSATVETVGYVQATYFHYDEKLGQLYLLDAVGFDDQALAAFKEQATFALGEERGLVGLVAQTRQPLIVPDTVREARWIPVDGTIRSALFVPVVHEQHLLGVAAVLSRQAQDFGEEDARNLTTLANNLAIAIENTQLFEQVQKSELYYRTILESSADAILGLDPELEITVWNSGAEQTFGYAKEESVGQPLDVLIPPQEKTRTEEALREAQEKGSVHGFQTQSRAKDGRLVDVEMTVTHLGPGLGYTAILRDITERKQAEEALRQSEEDYRQLFEAESDAIFLIDNETGRILQANNAACVLYGYNRKELLAKKNADLSAEPEQTRHVTRDTPIAADQVVTIPLRWHRKKDGTVFPVEITGRFFLHQGRLVHIAAIRDITERKRAEAQLNEQLDEMRRWHAVTLGRETRILDLKREVNELLARAGQPPRYPSAEDPKGLQDL